MTRITLVLFRPLGYFAGQERQAFLLGGKARRALVSAQWTGEQRKKNQETHESAA
jgi:hypothetical protein